MSLLSFRPYKYAPQVGINRKAGECDVLKNTTPMRVEGAETTRYGYSSAGLPSVPTVGGTPVTVDFWQYCSTENPSAKEVLFAFSHISSTQYVHVYSTVAYGSTAWTDGWVLLNESITLTVSGVSGATDTTAVVSGTGVSSVNDYYNGWAVVNDPAKKSALVLDYDGGTNTLTLLENIGSAGLNWANADSVILYRNFHNPPDTVGFITPSVHEIDGLFRIIFGQNSDATYNPVVFGYVKNTFNNVDTGSFTWQGTYADHRKIAAPNTAFTPIVTAGFQPAATGSDLETVKTYHIGIVAIYNGFQRSPMTFFPQASITGGTNDGYLDSSATLLELQIVLKLYPSRLDKRVTGYEIYVAQDEGDTSDRGIAETPYYFIRRFDFAKQANVTETEWTWSGVYFQAVEDLTLENWQSRGSSWEDSSGYIKRVDTMFNCDLEIKTPTRQWIARIYQNSKGGTDFDSIFTNPRNIEGLIQFDIFPDMPEKFRHRVKYGDQTVITGIVPVERGNILTLKDQSVSKLVTDEQPDGGLLIQTQTLSERVGCVSPIHGYVKTEYGVFFIGKDDFYLYNGELVELTKNDWREVYRAIPYAMKQAGIVWYRPDEDAVFLQLGSDVYAYYIRHQSWRQANYADTLAGYTVKRDGTFVWWKNGGAAFKFDTSSTDNGTAITTTIDTGTFRVGEPEQSARVFGAFLNREQSNAASGTFTLDYEGSANPVNYTVVSGKRSRIGLPINTRQWADRLRLQHTEVGEVQFNEIEVEGAPFKKKKVA